MALRPRTCAGSLAVLLAAVFLVVCSLRRADAAFRGNPCLRSENPSCEGCPCERGKALNDFYDELYWRAMTRSERKGWRAFGFDEETWDEPDENGQYRIEDCADCQEFGTLTREQQKGAKRLGYTRLTWDAALNNDDNCCAQGVYPECAAQCNACTDDPSCNVVNQILANPNLRALIAALEFAEITALPSGATVFGPTNLAFCAVGEQLGLSECGPFFNGAFDSGECSETCWNAVFEALTKDGLTRVLLFHVSRTIVTSQTVLGGLTTIPSLDETPAGPLCIDVVTNPVEELTSVALAPGFPNNPTGVPKFATVQTGNFQDSGTLFVIDSVLNPDAAAVCP